MSRSALWLCPIDTNLTSCSNENSIVNMSIANAQNISFANATNISFANAPNISFANATNISIVNAPNISFVNAPNMSFVNASNISIVNASNVPYVINTSFVNASNMSIVNATNMSIVNATERYNHSVARHNITLTSRGPRQNKTKEDHTQKPDTILSSPSTIPNATLNESFSNVVALDTDLSGLHVLWTLPVFFIILLLVRRKNVKIQHMWNAKRMRRCHSWPSCVRKRPNIETRSFSSPLNGTDFDSINKIQTR